jgi:hypothetical protein
MAQSGHHGALNSCLLSGVKRTLAERYQMSAYHPQETCKRPVKKPRAAARRLPRSETASNPRAREIYECFLFT